MAKIVFESSNGTRTVIEGAANQGSIMQVAKEHNVPGIDADCGGFMVCGTCHVLVDHSWQERLPAMSQAEREILEGVPDPAPNTRLTCQIPVSEALDGIVLRLPERQR